MKRVKITLFGKDYEFSTDSSDELIDYVAKRIKELQANYKKLYEEVPFDELLVLILCDLLENEYNSRKKIENLVNKLKERVSTLR
ncbi:MAG: cell division protein ZapA [Fervidobacterium sp.]|nr:cell division protein ZapA [Fervidobacterium sp.]